MRPVRFGWLWLSLALACARPGDVPSAVAPPQAADAAPPAAGAAAPPTAARRPKLIELHGEQRVDEYFWLRDKENPEVRAYLEAENAYAEAVMRPTEPLQQTLYREILSRIQQTDATVPTRKGDYLYYSRSEEGKQYPIFCRRRAPEGAEQVILDVNQLAQDHDFTAVYQLEVSDDGNLLAYLVDHTGFRLYTLHLRDLRTGRELADRAERVDSFAWSADGHTLFYVVEDAAKRPYRLYRHALGAAADPLVYEEPDQRFELYVRRSRSQEYVLLDVSSLTSDEVWFLPASRPTARFEPVALRGPDHQYSVELGDNRFYIRSNRAGRNFSVYTAPASSPGERSWKPLLPYRPAVMVESLDAYRGYLVVGEREDGVPQLRVIDLRTLAQHRVELPEPVRSVYPDHRQPYDSDVMRYQYESPIMPPSVVDYELASREQTLRKRQEVLGGYDPSRYRVERIHATAPDGTRIPISLLQRAGQARDGKAPCLLTGYGSYGVPYWIGFDSALFSLVDRGFVFAVAHIRGGGDLGKTWHDAGRMSTKRNTFTDFIAAGEELIARGYTGSDRLAIYGASAGGLLMGVVINQRPDLFRAAILRVPFVDVLNSMSDPALPLTVGEFEEWGNPAKPDEYRWMREYCPYTNLAAHDYPAMLVRTSWNDSQVMYWEPAKYTARLRTLRTDPHTFILKTSMTGGHGGRSGRYDRMRDVAYDYAFLLAELGLATGGDRVPATP